MSALYDSIGLNYANLRQPDPRIARRIEAALGDAETILNVGVGRAPTSRPAERSRRSYEPFESHRE